MKFSKILANIFIKQNDSFAVKDHMLASLYFVLHLIGEIGSI
jgi:hypothetical protein